MKCVPDISSVPIVFLIIVLVIRVVEDDELERGEQHLQLEHGDGGGDELLLQLGLGGVEDDQHSQLEHGGAGGDSSQHSQLGHGEVAGLVFEEGQLVQLLF